MNYLHVRVYSVKLLLQLPCVDLQQIYEVSLDPEDLAHVGGRAEHLAGGTRHLKLNKYIKH